MDVEGRYWFDIFAEASGMTFGDFGYIVDAEPDDFAKLKLTGPFIGASFRF